MNEENRAFYEDSSGMESYSRFQDSLEAGRLEYFDVADFEDIIEQLIDEGDYETAEIAILQAINIHPNAIPVRIRHAQSLIFNNQPATALRELDLLIALEGHNADVYLLKGNACLQLEQFSKAEECFSKAIQLAGPENDEILHMIGSAYADHDDAETAVVYFEKAWKANPNHEMALFDLAFYHDMLGNPERSIEYYNHYLDLDPYNLSAWFNLGIAYNRTLQFEKAIEAYDFAIAVYPTAYHAIFNKANSLANIMRYKEAIAAYREYLRYDSSNDDDLYRRVLS